MPSKDIESFRKSFSNAKNVIAVCGAGLSAASGIPTFRGAGGLWRKHKAMELATPEAFHENPSRVWQFYHYRREAAFEAQPNDAHRSLGLLTQPDVLLRVAPKCQSFQIITQNVDGLSPRVHQSLPDPAIARSKTWEMHGRVHDTICLSCGETKFDTRSPICESLRGTEKHFDSNDETVEIEIPLERLPRCEKHECGGLLRPGVVWFGETPHDMEELDKFVDAADLCLVVGTSSTVYPAAGYAHAVRSQGGKVAVFNLERSAGDSRADWLFLGGCEKTLPKALGLDGEL